MAGLEVLHEVEDLGLDGDIQGGNRLVGDDHGRAQDQGAGQAQPLPLAAGELVRVAVGGGSRQADLAEDVGDEALLAGPVALTLDDERLAQDGANPHPGVHGGIGVLEH